MVLWNQIDSTIARCFQIQMQINCFANSSISPRTFAYSHQQQGSSRLLGGKKTNYKEVCAQQTMKMPYRITQTEGTDVILPHVNYIFWGFESLTLQR